MVERKTQDEINDLKREQTEGFAAHTLRGPIQAATVVYVDDVVWTESTAR